MIPLSLYIHIPWCEKKCPYCDFNSHQNRVDTDEIGYVDALLLDLQQDVHLYRSALQNRELQSIFIGGGTPSLFSPTAIAHLLNGVKAELNLTSNCEVTMEANPGSSEADKFKGFREAGVNRLSIGIQSFNSEHLFSLGRVHNRDQALHAAEHARTAGFDNFNLDLMFGLPKQSLELCLQDVETALSLKPSHLSCYQLTIEPNTLFHHRPPPRPDDESLWQMQLGLQKRLAEQGYTQYEVSAYSKEGAQCQHNLNYWQFGDYLGIGAGAHGKITDVDFAVKRYWKIKHPDSYLRAQQKQHSFVGACSEIDAAQLRFEFMMNALRLSNGVATTLFNKRTGQDLESIRDVIDRHIQLGLMETTAERLQPTAKGHQFLDSLLQDYLPD